MALNFETTEGSTPLEPEELEQLIPTQITNMGQLNEAEQLNIAAAELWAYAPKRSNVLTAPFAQNLHKRMLGEVWKWAGEFRTRAPNIGNVDAYEIPTRLEASLQEAEYRIKDEVYEPGEIAVRLHHELTLIHAFPNGNGRHARLMANVLSENMGQPRLTWGSNMDLVKKGEVRARYIAALRAADEYDIQPLMEFACS